MSLWQRFLQASLWIASIGLMIASSGFDGAYLARMMPTGWGWLGLLLNTMADITSELGMYWYGRLQQDVKAKRKKARWILAGQVVLVGYAWLFGWRQLVPKMRQIDPDAATWMAPLAAAFIPMALIVLGYIQSLLAGRIEDAKPDKESAKPAPVDVSVDKPVDNVAPNVPELTTDERRERVLAAMLAPEPPTQSELAEQLAVSRSTIGNDVSVLREAGRLNGQGGH